MKELTIDQLGKQVQAMADTVQQEHFLVTRDGKPVAVLLGIENKDREDGLLEISPEFWQMISERRREAAVPLKDIEAELFNEVEKLKGSVSWIWEDEKGGRKLISADVVRGVLRGGEELAVHCQFEGWDYNISLKRIRGARFQGTFEGRKGQSLSPVTASCRLYSNEDGYVLTGTWIEEGHESKWWAELDVIEAFADEQTPVRAKPQPRKPARKRSSTASNAASRPRTR